MKGMMEGARPASRCEWIAGEWRQMLDRLVLARNYLLDCFASVLPGPKQSPGLRKYLLVVKLDAIGDFVLWLDAAAGLRRLYPADRYYLVLVANALWADLAAQQPYFEEIIPLDTRRLPSFQYRATMWKKLRGRPWDLAINPTYSRHFPYDDAVIRVCGATERIGFQGDLSNQRAFELAISDRWYTRLVPASPEPLMELERNAEFVRGLGLKDFRAGVPALKVTAEPPPLLAGSGYCVVVPGASLPIKQWPLDNFAELVQRIRSRYGLMVVVCGAAAERELGQRLMQLVPDAAGTMHDMTGSTSLAEFAAIIKGASLVVANDSSAVHIAAAVGTKSICFAGGGHYGRFVPYRVEAEANGPLPVTVMHRMECYHCNWNCVCQYRGGAAPCLEQISPDDAWREVQALLSDPRNPLHPTT